MLMRKKQQQAPKPTFMPIEGIMSNKDTSIAFADKPPNEPRVARERI